MTKDEKILTIDLFGTFEEGLYQLGLKDRDEAKFIIDHIKALISLPNPMATKIIEGAVKKILEVMATGGNDFEENLMAYAEGLNLPKNEVQYCLLIPELMCFMAKWIPGIPSTLLGCSSFFTKNEDESITHIRILDFPLQGSYDKYERLVRSRFDDHTPLVTFGTAGLPFPALTTRTEDGRTLAIHQKFSDIFNHRGQSIFQLTTNLLNNAKTIDEAIEYCKNHPSITSWNINMAFPSSEILEMNLLGEQIEYKIHKLGKGDILYINNSLKDCEYTSSKIPLNIESYNALRTKSAHKKIKLYQKKKTKNDIEFLKMVTTLHYHKDPEMTLDPLTPSSVSVVAMNTKHDSLYTIPGAAPKVFDGKILEISHSFDREIKQKIISSKPPNYPKHLLRGHRSLMAAQVAFDKKDFHNSYHQIQMAMEDLKNTPLHSISTFYFLVLQFIFDKHRKIRKELIVEFKNIQKVLPDHLQDHCKLFIFRLEKLLNIPYSVHADDFTNKEMGKILETEKKLSNLFFHSFIAKTMNMRIDLLDIIYPHIRLLD